MIPRVWPAALFLLPLMAGCAAPALPQKPRAKDKAAVWRSDVVAGAYADTPAPSGGSSAAAPPVLSQQSVKPPPIIRRRPHRRPADVDMGPDDDDDAADPADTAQDAQEKEPKPSTGTAASPQAQPQAEPEPEGPLIQRKHQDDAGAAPDVDVNVKDIKPLPTSHGHVKFPPPPEDQADEDELEIAIKAKKTKMATPTMNVDVAPGEAMTMDPSSLGSYHVEVSTSPRFRPVFLDNVYGFGTDIRLEDDVDAAGGKTGKYYIRWALVDLLDMEHPFHKTKYFIFISPSEMPPTP
jgi:hypothetical protein